MLRITVDGVGSWTSDDYTLGEMAAIEEATKVRWSWHEEHGPDEAAAQMALVVAWLARTAPDREAAEKQAAALTRRQVRVVKVDDDRPIEWDDGLPVVDPKAATDGSGTTSSSGP